MFFFICTLYRVNETHINTKRNRKVYEIRPIYKSEVISYTQRGVQSISFINTSEYTVLIIYDRLYEKTMYRATANLSDDRRETLTLYLFRNGNSTLQLQN